MKPHQKYTLETLEKSFNVKIDYDLISKMTDEEIETYINKIDDDLFNDHFKELQSKKITAKRE